MNRLYILVGAALTAITGAQDYHVEIAQRTSPQGPATTIDPLTSINDRRECAFTGLDTTGVSRGFMVTEQGVASAITFGSATRNFAGAAINNEIPARVATRDRVSSTWLMRRWPADGSQTWVVVGRSPTHFDSCSQWLDVNDSSNIVFVALTQGSTRSALLFGTAEPPLQIADFAGIPLLRPQLSNDYTARGGRGARVVVRDGSNQIVVFDALASATGRVMAGPTVGGFTAVGPYPGISHDGEVVTFIGNRGSGEVRRSSALSSRTMAQPSTRLSPRCCGPSVLQRRPHNCGTF